MIKAAFLSALLMSSPALGNDYERAGRYAARAFVKQQGIDKAFRRLEKKYIPEDIREVGAGVLTIAKVIQEKKVVLSWEF